MKKNVLVFMTTICASLFAYAESKVEPLFVRCEGSIARVGGAVESMKEMDAVVIQNRSEVLGRRSLGQQVDLTGTHSAGDVFEVTVYLGKNESGLQSLFVEGALTKEENSIFRGVQVRVLGNASAQTTHLDQIELTVANTEVLSKIRNHKEYNRAILSGGYVEMVKSMVDAGQLDSTDVSSVTIKCSVNSKR
ncbi:MAG: hypothetical protein BroJett040_01720 [Oligoflexia bacterium]|nr:MAG: hypothetical protein BroJett040_01720 [Oligoflexia bacterium]